MKVSPTMTKPFSQACENNKQPILDKLTPLLANRKNVLEVGSGTGQHAVHFAQALPHITWQTGDLAINHAGINQWLNQANLPNLMPPLVIDFNDAWPIKNVDVIFTANTLHIVSFELVKRFFIAVGKHLPVNGLLCVYGPFKYNEQFTSPSNESFDLWLKDNDTQSGIRDIETIEQLANNAGLTLVSDQDMPANNRFLTLLKR